MAMRDNKKKLDVLLKHNTIYWNLGPGFLFYVITSKQEVLEEVTANEKLLASLRLEWLQLNNVEKNGLLSKGLGRGWLRVWRGFAPEGSNFNTDRFLLPSGMLSYHYFNFNTVSYF